MKLFGRKRAQGAAAPPLLQTPGLVLRAFDANDAVDILECAKSEGAGPMASGPPLLTAEDSRLAVEKFIRDGIWAVVEKKSGRVIGAVGLTDDARRRVEGALELGYILGEKYALQGLEAEACAAVLAYAFGDLQCPVVSAGHAVQNQRVRRVMKKLGFTCEGMVRLSWSLPDGARVDELRYSLLREEYQPASK